jgi:serine protease inhibitor
MVVDRPFMFALRDAVTGLILVAGYVGQPTPLATAAQ